MASEFNYLGVLDEKSLVNGLIMANGYLRFCKIVGENFGNLSTIRQYLISLVFYPTGVFCYIGQPLFLIITLLRPASCICAIFGGHKIW